MRHHLVIHLTAVQSDLEPIRREPCPIGAEINAVQSLIETLPRDWLVATLREGTAIRQYDCRYGSVCAR